MFHILLLLFLINISILGLIKSLFPRDHCTKEPVLTGGWYTSGLAFLFALLNTLRVLASACPTHPPQGWRPKIQPPLHGAKMLLTSPHLLPSGAAWTLEPWAACRNRSSCWAPSWEVWDWRWGWWWTIRADWRENKPSRLKSRRRSSAPCKISHPNSSLCSPHLHQRYQHLVPWPPLHTSARLRRVRVLTLSAAKLRRDTTKSMILV